MLRSCQDFLKLEIIKLTNISSFIILNERYGSQSQEPQEIQQKRAVWLQYAETLSFAFTTKRDRVNQKETWSKTVINMIFFKRINNTVLKSCILKKDQGKRPVITKKRIAPKLESITWKARNNMRPSCARCSPTAFNLFKGQQLIDILRRNILSCLILSVTFSIIPLYLGETITFRL